MRRISGVLIGAAIAMAVIWLIEYIGHLAMPTDAPRTGDPAALEAYVTSMPFAMKMIMVVGWFLGAAIGGLAALMIARWLVAPWIVAGLVALGGIINAVQIPSPMWMQLATVFAPALGGWAAVHFGRRSLAGR